MSKYVIDSDAGEITLNLELETAREMTETVEKRKNLWIKR